jgi:hypothetical protein
MRRALCTLGLATLLACLWAAPAARAEFGLLPGEAGFAAMPEEGGAPYATAGGHPYALRAHLALTTAESPDQPGLAFPEADLRELTLTLPPGLLANPSALPQCEIAAFHTPRSSPFEPSASGESCPLQTQVGTVQVTTPQATRRFGLFNLAPPPGAPAQLGFAPFGQPIALTAQLRPGPQGAYTLSLEARNLTQSLSITALDLALWGTPWAASHDTERGNCLNEQEPSFPWAKCSVGPPVLNPPAAYLTMPTDCSAPLRFTATASAWQGGSASATHTPEAGGAPLAPKGCAQLRFEPSAFGRLSTDKASTASGYDFQLFAKADGLTDPAGRIGSPIRRASVTLPAGVTLNPSVGAGLGVCTEAELARESATSAEGEGCPNAAKIGSFTVATPLAEGRLQGAIYLAEPERNRFGSLLAVYLIARSAERGFLVKLAGRLDPDPATGTLAATFDDLPQIPYDDLAMSFRSGQRAPLITPAACGPAQTQVEMTPWAGGLLTQHSSTASQIDSGVGGGPCPAGTPPFSPQVTAGSVNSNVGSYSPFYLRLSRADTEQEITSYSMVLPRGITGRLAGLPFCAEAQIAAARANSGLAEAERPSCPAASQIGRSDTGYGVGGALTYAPGRFYMAGPYRGSPLSIVSVNSATVGPFDLGTIVIRFAFDVDERTAQLRINSAGSDPIPHILRGIPLHLREIRVHMDRARFTRNPSSCLASKVSSTLAGSGASFATAADDSSATVANHFQLLNCRTLGFRPKLGIRLRGPARRGAFPSLRATFASRGDRDANLKEISVTMPHSLFLAQQHIRTVCTRREFAAERCPAGSVYGHAVAHTPLFDEPLRGNVYLRSSSHRLPDLVASIRSGAVRIAVEGKIGPAKHGIEVRFEDLPDAPITRFVMTLRGGRHGLLVNSSNICANPPLASVKALGQTNLGSVFTTRLRGQCAKGKGKAKGKGGGGR